MNFLRQLTFDIHEVVDINDGAGRLTHHARLYAEIVFTAADILDGFWDGGGGVGVFGAAAGE